MNRLPEASMSPLLEPLSRVYESIVRARLALYRRGVLASRSVSAPVISVGNITTGGTGKTPLVAWLAEIAYQETCAAEAACICVLSRGYGRVDARKRVVVSDGKSILADARTGGDEPRELAEHLLGTAAVISDANRYEAARWAIANLATKIFILDDGFQHIGLKRDLDILAVDATNPFGSGKMLPRGRLREPLSSLARADCFVITRADQVPSVADLRQELQRLSDGKRVFTAHARTRGVYPLDEAQEPLNPRDIIPHTPVVAFGALGNPAAFFTHLRRDGWNLRDTLAFRDHHPYTQADLDKLALGVEQTKAHALITTAKDAVKLRGLRCRVPCYVVKIALEITDADELRALVCGAVRL